MVKCTSESVRAFRGTGHSEMYEQGLLPWYDRGRVSAHRVVCATLGIVLQPRPHQTACGPATVPLLIDLVVRYPLPEDSVRCTLYLSTVLLTAGGRWSRAAVVAPTQSEDEKATCWMSGQATEFLTKYEDGIRYSPCPRGCHRYIRCRLKRDANV